MLPVTKLLLAAAAGNFNTYVCFIQLEVINCFADFIVPRNKRNTIGFFCFAFDTKMPLGKSTFFAYVISPKRSNV